MPLDFSVNKRKCSVQVPEDTPLLWVLREELELSGTKFGCGKGLCGACTVHLNGTAIRSCITPVAAVKDTEVTTIEGGATAKGSVLEAVQEAWVALDVAQCGYCQPGQIMSATALLQQNPEPDEAAIAAAMSGNICRCGTYPLIRAAILQASQALKQPQGKSLPEKEQP